MSLSGEDSDATVLADDNEATSTHADPANKSVDESQCVVCESPGTVGSSPKSPSILHTSLKSLLHQRSSRKESDPSHFHDVFQSSTEEAMSQEFPPLTSTEASSTQKPSTNQPEQSSGMKENPPPLSSSEPTLQDVAKQQSNLLQEIRQLSLIPPPSSEALSGVRSRATAVEQRLKAISSANQAERKKLAEAHSNLSLQVNSQQEFVTESQTLKQQLIGLANKQKLLLECFSRQKEIGVLLSQLMCPSKVVTESNDSDQTQLPSSKELSEKVLNSLSSLHVSAPPTGVLSRIPVATQSMATTFLPQTSAVSVMAVPPSKHLLAASIPSNIAPAILSIESNAHFYPQTSTGLTHGPHSSHPHNPHSSNPHNSHSSRHHGPPTDVSTNKPPAVVKPSILSNKASAATNLSEPVPLDTLIKHGFLEPAPACLSCHILGCQFRGSLLRDGSVQESSGNTQTCHQLPRQWVKACWAQLGHHHKKITKKIAYSCVLYRDKPLISYCEEYSQKQVSSYLSLQSGMEITRPADSNRFSANEGGSGVIPHTLSVSSTSQNRATAAPTRHQFNLSQLLREGSVFLLPHPCSSGLNLPPGFWTGRDVSLTPQLVDQLQADLNW